MPSAFAIADAPKPCAFNSLIVEFRPEEFVLAKKMTAIPYREFLIRLMQVKSFDEGQLEQEISGLPSGSDFIDFLVVAGFIERQGQITCRKNRSKLGCVAANEENSAYGAIWCPHCGKTYAEESFALVFSGTPALKAMMK
jgi:hypothetical protein